MNRYSRVHAEIDLDAILYNMESMRNNISEKTKIMAVIKADGYGHGAVEIAEAIDHLDYLCGYAVATVEEGLILRNHGIKKPILILGYVFPDQYADMIKAQLRPTVFTRKMAEELSVAAGSIGLDCRIHFAVDTGMSRIGYQVTPEAADEMAQLAKLPHIMVEGIFTHFAKADEEDKSCTEKQLNAYLWMKQRLEEKGVQFSYYHCSNSAGIIDVPEANMDLVRAGISIYGLYPSGEVNKANVPLKPALQWVSHVAHVKWVEAGTPVSYGGTYVTDHRTKLATIPVGYGDGYPRSLSNKGYVLIKGQKAPIRGRVCMDQMMVDVTEIDDVAYEDQVILVGRDGEEELPVEVLSDLSGRFNYEFVCDIGKRVPREFYRHGEITEQMDWF